MHVCPTGWTAYHTSDLWTGAILVAQGRWHLPAVVDFSVRRCETDGHLRADEHHDYSVRCTKELPGPMRCQICDAHRFYSTLVCCGVCMVYMCWACHTDCARCNMDLCPAHVVGHRCDSQVVNCYSEAAQEETHGARVGTADSWNDCLGLGPSISPGKEEFKIRTVCQVCFGRTALTHCRHCYVLLCHVCRSRCPFCRNALCGMDHCRRFHLRHCRARPPEGDGSSMAVAGRAGADR